AGPGLLSSEMYLKKNKKTLAFPKTFLYNADVVTLIAKKREVAVQINVTGFPWSECQVKKLATSHCTN
ncbi:MAG: hypothetical protein KH281_10050, partial [Lachnospiraceae bacterium]|nr:hypothetical protein [Lachnospiraceae bacterium]